MKELLRILVFFSTLSLLTACSILSNKQEALTIYAPVLDRTVLHAVVQNIASQPWQLTIQTPVAINPINSARIAVMPRPGVFEFYKGARWRDRSPVLLQQMLLQSFQDSGRLPGVSTPGSGLRSSYGLHTDLRDFQAEYRQTDIPVVVIRLYVQLIDYADNHIVDASLFEVEQPCFDSSIATVAAAFERGLNTLLPQIVGWALEIGSTKGHAVQSDSTVIRGRPVYEQSDYPSRCHADFGSSPC